MGRDICSVRFLLLFCCILHRMCQEILLVAIGLPSCALSKSDVPMRERERERERLLRGTGVTADNKKQVQLQPSNYTHSLQHTAYHSILLLQLPSTATNSCPNVLLYREEHRTQSNQINQYFIVCSILVLMLNWIECPVLPV